MDEVISSSPSADASARVGSAASAGALKNGEEKGGVTAEQTPKAAWLQACWRAGGFPLIVALAAGAHLALRPPAPASAADAAVLLALRPGEAAGHVPPLWWAAGRALAALTGDAFASLHLTVVAGWLALLWAVWRVAVHWGLGAKGGWMAAVVVGSWPTLLWRVGTVGPEVLGLGLAVVAALLFVKASKEGGSWWAAVAAAVAAGGLWADTLWLVAPFAVGAIWLAAGRDSCRRGMLPLVAGIAMLALLWGGWRLAAGPTGANWLVTGNDWGRTVGNQWLALAVLALAAVGAVRAWRQSRQEIVAVAAAALLCAGIKAMASSAVAVLVAVPAVALLAAAACGGEGRCPALAVAGVVVWASLALGWAWPSLWARRELAPAWNVLNWARTHLDVAAEPIVYDPGLEASVRLVLAPAGFTLLRAGTAEAQAALEAGQGVVWLGVRARPGAKVLHAQRWISGRVQRLVRREDAHCVASWLERTDPVRVSRAWKKVDGVFELAELGVVALEEGTAPRVVKLKPATGRVRVRIPGRRPMELDSESPLFAAVLLPGVAGALSFEPMGGPVRFAVAELAPLVAGSQALIVPQAAAVTGIGGSYWQTDLMLANPHPAPVTAEVTFLPSGKANVTAPRVRFEIPGSSSRLVTNILAVREFRQGPRTGALLVQAVGCNLGACGLEVLSRTYNIQAEGCDPTGEGLPACPPEQGLRSGATAVFEGVANDAAHRGYVGFASWGGSPVVVRVVLVDGLGSVVGQLEEQLSPWSHRHLRLPVRVQRATLKVVVEGGGETLVFPYLSTVDSARNCPTHRYPDRIEGPRGEGLRPQNPAEEANAAPNA